MPELCTPWIIGDDLADIYTDDPGCATALADLPVDVLDDAAYLASAILFRLTGSKYTGGCEAIVRPCARRPWNPGPAWSHGVTRPVGWPGTGYNGLGPPAAWAWVDGWGTCGCSGGRSCGCASLSQVSLGVYPIISIDEVWLDGAQLASDGSEYALVEDKLLERRPGAFWPTCSNVWGAETDPDTFVVHVTWGEEPPFDGIIAAKRYGTELALGMCNKECNLPSRVQSIIRQGVTVNFADASALAKDGKTGVPMVDTWLAAINEGLARPHAPATITSPDIPRAVRHDRV